jgi:hypothetical protein
MLLAVAVGVAAVMCAAPCGAGFVDGSPRVEIFVDRGHGGVYAIGERADVFIRPLHDCYVIVYGVDTEGYLSLLFPSDCIDDGFVVADRIYRIGHDELGRFHVSGPRGIQYIHVLASYRPFRRLYWHGCAGYERYAMEVSWSGFQDYWGCALPARIYGDPYVAMQTIDEFICMEALDAAMVYADFTYFYVDRVVEYPRTLCYDCHGFGTCIRPYVNCCTGFRITFHFGDPCFRPSTWWWWCAPGRCYCGPRYVCHMLPSCPPRCRVSCGTSCSSMHRTYPRTYKWKTRTECGEGFCDARGAKTSAGRLTMPATKSRASAAAVRTPAATRTKASLSTVSLRNPRTSGQKVRTSQAARVDVPERQAASRQGASGQAEVKTRESGSSGDSGSVVGTLFKILTSRSSDSDSKDDRRGSSVKSSGSKSTVSEGKSKSSSSSDKRVAPKVRDSSKGRSQAKRR